MTPSLNRYEDQISEAEAAAAGERDRSGESILIAGALATA
jgi:hypothetical protein